MIGAGDFASIHEGLEQTIEALSAIETPTVLVPGNNETADALRAAATAWPAATVLHGETAEVERPEFFGLGAGIPITPWDWSFDLSDEEATAALEDCPDGASSSCTRRRTATATSPARATTSAAPRWPPPSSGMQPPLAVCGHIHESWGASARGSARPRSRTSDRTARSSRSTSG